MNDKTECTGCYLFENRIPGICNYDPHPTKHTSCPCIKCIVKSMCNSESGCELFSKIYYPEEE